MVRGPAAVLAVYAAALAYFALAGSLPALGSRDATAIAAGSLALVAVAACALALLPARDEVGALVLLALGGGLVAGALTVAGAGVPATVAKALFAATAGLLLARWLDAPAVLIAVALFVAAIDVASVVAGPSSVLIAERPRIADFLTFSLPLWGGGATQLGLSDVLFLAFFASGAWRHGLRRRATAIAMTAAMAGALIVAVLANLRALPVLPALALGLLAPNADRLGALLSDSEPG